MKRCRTCVIPNTRPDTYFDETGECAACVNYRQRPTIDWAERKAELLALLDRHDGRCIVPSSGGKDSHFQVLTLLELGARPLIVTASTCMLTEIGRKNINNLARYAETAEITPMRDQRAKLNRLGLEMVGDISWPEHVAIFTIPFTVACHLEIPLIFYGESPQREYGGPKGAEQAREMTRRWVSEFGGFNGLRPSDMAIAGDMSYYTPPPAAELARVGVEAHFLGQYLPWDSHRNAEVAHEAGMLQAKPCAANWWKHENLDNAQTGIHDHMMYRKFGFGRGCQQISVDVRAGRVTREDALTWVRKWDGVFPYSYLNVPYEEVLRHISMTRYQFEQTLQQFTNPELFEDITHDRPILKFDHGAQDAPGT